MARVSSYLTNHDFLNWGGQLLTNLKIDTYEGTPSNTKAASAPEVAFFVLYSYFRKKVKHIKYYIYD